MHGRNKDCVHILLRKSETNRPEGEYMNTLIILKRIRFLVLPYLLTYSMVQSPS